MKRIHKRYLKTISLTWASSLVLLVLGYVTVLGPQGKVARDMSRELSEKERSYNEALEASQQHTKDKLSAQLQQLQDRVGDFVVDFEESAKVTFDIGRIVDELKIGSFNIQNRGGERRGAIEIETEYVSENEVEITFEADFSQFAFLLNKLERHRPVLFVEKFNILPADRDGKPQASMSLVYLVRKPQED